MNNISFLKILSRFTCEIEIDFFIYIFSKSVGRIHFNSMFTRKKCCRLYLFEEEKNIRRQERKEENVTNIWRNF